MRAFGADSEELLAHARQHDGLSADMPAQKRSLAEIGYRDTLRQVGAFILG